MCPLEEADRIGDRRSRPEGQSEGDAGVGKCSLSTCHPWGKLFCEAEFH